MWEYLQERGIFDFGGAHHVIAQYLEETSLILARSDPAVDVVADLMHLNAAEFALTAVDPSSLLYRGLSEGPPIEVSGESGARAITATDSGPFVGHDPASTQNVWDVTLFSSDASKLVWISGAKTVELLRDRFVTAVEELGRLYADRRFEASTRELRPTFPFRAVLWRAKLAILGGETPGEVDIDRVFDAAREQPEPAY